MTTIKELFNIDYGQGEYHSKEHLDLGDGFLISSQGVDNGCYGFFNVPSKYAPPLITIPSTGSIGEAFVQTNFCSVDDNCLVLEPKNKLPLDYLFYVATKVRIQRWRYMYGRKCYKAKLQNLQIELPATADGKIDQDLIEKIVKSQDVFGYIAEMLKV